MAEQIGLRRDSRDTPHEDDAPAAKRARALTDKNHGVDGADSALPKSPIARRAERSDHLGGLGLRSEYIKTEASTASVPVIKPTALKTALPLSARRSWRRDSSE